MCIYDGGKTSPISMIQQISHACSFNEVVGYEEIHFQTQHLACLPSRIQTPSFEWTSKMIKFK